VGSSPIARSMRSNYGEEELSNEAARNLGVDYPDDTMLDLLERSHVFSLTKVGDTFRFEECCDNWFVLEDVSKDQMRQLIAELTALVEQ
jgi:hypothetical protein